MRNLMKSAIISHCEYDRQCLIALLTTYGQKLSRIRNGGNVVCSNSVILISSIHPPSVSKLKSSAL
jgi:hypothetical protein